MAVRCAVELQLADGYTGRNISSMMYPRAMLIRRRGGLEVMSDDPPLHKAIKIEAHKYEVYSSYAAMGKMALIRRERSRITQYNFREGDPEDMVALRDFCIRTGGISKSKIVVAAPVARRSLPSTPVTDRRAGIKRPRSAFTDLTNSSQSPGRDSQRRKTSPHASTPLQPVHRHANLTKEQKRVLELIKQGKNVFFTGCAGTGKSFLLQHLLKHGCGHAMGRVFATATTGIAAYNIGGMTLHHFAGIDPRAHMSRQELLQQISRKKDAIARWKSARILVIDEVSMLDGRLFDDLEAVARQIRRNSAFFGGIQLILSGDFFQLPPVGRRVRDQGARLAPPLLCFESSAWARGITETVVLKEIFRQRDDEFVRILNAFRVGRPTTAMIEKLNERYDGTSSTESDSDDAIHILSHNDDVLRTNARALDELGGKKFNYLSADRGKTEFLTTCPAPAKLSLKKNARVLLIKTLNAARGLVNGSRGIVEGFTPQSNLPIVRFSNGVTETIGQEEFSVSVADTVLASRRQLPLALAWAISIHKSQGLSFDTAVLDLSRVFEFGQAYVALSRVRSLEGLRLRARIRDRNGGRLLADSRVVDFYEAISNK
ncbi:PIF1-like helicase [Phytophthora infestans]|uniref:ATP-dependent DNA helicase n=1 Tax=Phytophthora infestans TaxID=4787 RepID=A0A833SZQ9_PHYIN|nr:PIF1-like helicase [Phytophthora infestans]KAF4135892.1 PIF1-like helicase [Phytophthora infestans]